MTLRAVYDLFPVLEERSNRPGTMLVVGSSRCWQSPGPMANPNLILLDEPSEGLSPVLIDGLVGALNAIRKAGTGVLVVEQHLNLVKRATDRFIILAMEKSSGLDRPADWCVGEPGADSSVTTIGKRGEKHEKRTYGITLRALLAASTALPSL